MTMHPVDMDAYPTQMQHGRELVINLHSSGDGGGGEPPTRPRAAAPRCRQIFVHGILKRKVGRDGSDR